MLAAVAATLALAAPIDPVVVEAVEVTRKHFFDADLLEQRWADVDRHLAAAAAAGHGSSATINHLLGLLDTSHTGHFTPDEPAYYELLDIYGRFGPIAEQVEAMFPNGVAYTGIEAFMRELDGSTFVTAVWSGGPADRAGLRVGDELLAADGEPFHPMRSFAGKAGRPVDLSVRRRRDAEPMQIAVTPHRIEPNGAFERAMRDSARIIDSEDQRIGYIRAYSYAGQRYHDVLVEELSTGRLRDVDALILDLRGGWGGASPQHAELFTGGAPDMIVITREGDDRIVSFRWRRPVVALIDEGTRSGKEVLAHAFRNAGIELVGTTTAGAVVAGQGFLLHDGSLLVVAVMDVLVDGQRLEGIGVAPTIDVPFDLRYAAGDDPQLTAAVEGIQRQLDTSPRREQGRP